MAIRTAVGSRKQAVLLGVLGIVLVLAVVKWRPGGSAAPKMANVTTSVFFENRPD